jgi:phage gpG-like protein
MSKVELDARAFKRLTRELNSGPTRAKVGILSRNGGSARYDNGLSVVEVAAIHEYGAPGANIPERSFIRAPFEGNPSDLKKITKKLARAVLGGMPMSQAMGLLGEWGVAKIRRYVSVGGNLAPLKPSTIKRKKSSKPLIDTGRLMNAVSYEVD